LGYSNLRDLSKAATSREQKIEEEYGLNSSSNYLLYGGGNGKALAYDQLVLTNEGFIAMRDIKIGDKIYNSKGELYTVIEIPYDDYSQVCILEFNDGTRIKCSPEHIWEINLEKDGIIEPETLLTTKDIIEQDSLGKEMYVPSVVIPGNKTIPRRKLVKAEFFFDKKEKMKCITTSSPDSIFITDNYIPTHNSTLSLTQIHEGEAPIFVVSAAGGSNYLKKRYPNAVIRTGSTLNEIEVYLQDLENNYKILNAIQRYMSDPVKLKKFRDNAFLPTYYPDEAEQQEGIEDFNYLLSLAKENKFIYSRVIVEECDVISKLIQDKVEGIFDTEILGEDKSLRGKDWNALSAELVSYYSRWLSLPCMTIFATSDKLPSERQGLEQIIPALCTGAGQRLLTAMIGNVLFVGNDEKGFFVQVKPSKEAFIRTKFYELNTDFDKIPTRIDITNNAAKFWEFVEECKNGEYTIKNNKNKFDN